MVQQCRHIPYRGKIGVEEAAAGTDTKPWRKMSAADDEQAGRMRTRKEGHSPYLSLLRSNSKTSSTEASESSPEGLRTCAWIRPLRGRSESGLAYPLRSPLVKHPNCFFPLYFSVPYLPDGWKPVKGSFSPPRSLSLSLSLSHIFFFSFFSVYFHWRWNICWMDAWRNSNNITFIIQKC